jgi:hypothetical protein
MADRQQASPYLLCMHSKSGGCQEPQDAILARMAREEMYAS